MKLSKIVVITFAAFIAICVLYGCGLTPSRGKVIASSSGILNYKLHEASVFSISMQEDSSAIIEGEVCVLGDNDVPTGEYIKMVPRSFPSWFVFGCDDNGSVVTFKIKTLGNGEKLAVVKVPKRH